MCFSMQHIHILGICGTFMGSLAQLAIAKGYRVTGCDANVYPPMSTQLEAAGIELIEGYDVSQLDMQPDLLVIGNAMSRGNPLVEAILDRGLPYTSGPQWLRENILQGKWVLAVAGTHGKTTTSSMLAWILEYAGMSPGYLIGGVPTNFSVSARLGETPFFVIEADEYDSAFFDKRSKFLHYLPRTLVINNLEFDHGDIFADLGAIQTQFHHVVRTVPNNGLVTRPSNSTAIDEVIERGCWTPIISFSASADDEKAVEGWSFEWVNTDGSSTKIADGSLSETADGSLSKTADGSSFSVLYNGEFKARLSWPLLGQHNVNNALAAIAAAHHVGVTPEVAVEALSQFNGVKRRMECLYDERGVRIYDDFAHHPTAIDTTLKGLRASVGVDQKIIVLIEPRSNTMRMGIHQQALCSACDAADHVLWYCPPTLGWDIDSVIQHSSTTAELCTSIEQLVEQAQVVAMPTASNTAVHIVIMSNGGFGGVHTLLVDRFKQANNAQADNE